MNQKIKQYWEKQGKAILLQTESDLTWQNVPAYYYHMNGNGPKVFVACPYINGELVYWNYPNWLTEEEMLKIIG